MARAIRKSAAIVLAAGLTFAGVGGVAIESAVAGAQQTVSTINPNNSRSLTIHKRFGAETNTKATGQEMAGVPGQAGNGVEFQIELVQKLDTPADWEAARTLTVENATADTSFSPQTKTTGADGVAGDAYFNNLPMGVYRVTETAVPTGVIAGKPFLVYVPMAAENGDWIYNVHAYPKNNTATIAKSVKDAGIHNGGNVEYTIVASGDSAAGAGVGDNFVFTDTLPAGLDAAGATATPSFVDSSAGTLVANTDYTVTKNGQQVTVTFTEAGRNKITTANKRVQVVISAKYDGTVNQATNKATVTAGNTTYTSNEVVSHWGNVTITKKSSAGAGLQGADFQLVQCQAGAGGAWSQVVGTQPETVGTTATFTTGADGKVTINGIHVQDYVDGAAGDAAKYCVKETKAPAGYVGDDNLRPVNLTVANKNASVEITNSTSRNLLPNTGGMGIVLIVLAGLGIVGAGAFAARRNAA
ncbi:SpaH/EbpB family LPXTG-anchored major pilin [Corynebacterium aquatimens]|uniref:Fimbrial isopeptide formation D2 family protein/LPXTG-motif cell wall-anchored protein n=1 Tax=Corynebacterium aquatimens TaxID=1190508 RepID=A0A931GWQ6_9CORY|nr:SpaH/EbpB family LPXTG-anchored major pilin [Corynebacterium aquatimens]MBG6122941.1 fimbrial isopeptide formation D2 family protein/LPXTG-motif cell wall-anchored protein [Corynebacterium aquatimens]WJY66724.1 Fimbrial subunit type 1 precursor [Corynebacterium aquatimens]